MAEVTIKKLAGMLDTEVDKLLTQLTEAGMAFNDPDQVISNTEKMKLLGFLRRTHGKREVVAEDSDAGPRQVTLKRRKISEITVNPGQRGAVTKKVNVEVRQKRTYVKRTDIQDQIDPEREEAARKLVESQQKREAE
ncbi:MAG: translation initiation factor IF-2 associated domain-containing protein, partial [Rhodanobacteraceae bacterium]